MSHDSRTILICVRHNCFGLLSVANFLLQITSKVRVNVGGIVLFKQQTLTELCKL